MSMGTDMLLKSLAPMLGVKPDEMKQVMLTVTGNIQTVVDTLTKIAAQNETILAKLEGLENGGHKD